jgi:hypothetical protein
MGSSVSAGRKKTGLQQKPTAAMNAAAAAAPRVPAEKRPEASGLNFDGSAPKRQRMEHE